jgi:WD40 repeat protein
MAWPLSQDYNEAIQNPQTSFSDPELRQGQVVVNAFGIPQPCSGNFADVYAVECPATQTKWAVKCFTREVRGLRDRYSEISKYLQQVNLPFTVDFQYLEQGIRVAGRWYPVLKMHWIEGFTLNTFVRDMLDKPNMLEALGRIWVRMAHRLREVKLGHCDLQHGNVLLVPGISANALALKLIDYDGMWVPALARSPSGEIGHPAYQHPQRLREATYNPEVDRFPLLVIITALRGLAVGGRALWEKYDTGDNLLFRQQDFEAPSKSPLLADLLRLNNPEVRELVIKLIDAARMPLEQVPHLADLYPIEAPVTTSPRAAVTPARSAVASAPKKIISVRKERAARRGKRSWGCVMAAGAAVLAVSLGGGALYWAMAFTDWFDTTTPTTNRLQARAVPTEPPEPPLAKEGQPKEPAPADEPKPEDVPPPDKPKPEEPTPPPDKPKPNDTPPPPVKPKPAEDTPPPPKPKPEDTPPPPKPKPEDKPSPRPVVKVPLPEGAPGVVRSFEVPVAQINGVALSPDGRLALAGGEDGIARLWDVQTGEELRQFKGHEGPIQSLAFSPNGRRILTGSKDKTARVWDTDKGTELARFQEHGDWVRSVAFSPDGKRALTACVGPSAGDNTVRLWDAANGKELQVLRGHEKPVSCAAFTPDGLRAVSGGDDYTVRLWDLADGRELRKCTGHEAFIYSVAVSGDGRVAASAAFDRTMRLWDLDSGEELRRLDGHTKFVMSVAFSPDGRRLLSGSLDKTLRLWDRASGRELARFDTDDAGVRCVAFSSDGRFALAGSADKAVQLWRLPPADVLAGKPDDPVGPAKTFTGHSQLIRRVAFSFDGQHVLSAGHDGTVRLWETATGRETLVFNKLSDPHFHTIAFLPDGTRAVAGGDDRVVRMWDLRDGRELRAFRDHTRNIYKLAISPDGRRVVSGGQEPFTLLWELETGEVLHRLDGHGAGSESVCFSPDGRWVLVGYDSGSIHLWDATSGKDSREFQGHKMAVISVQFTPDSRRVLSASRDRTLRLWDVATGKELHRFEGHTDQVEGAALSPDGRRAVSGGWDRTVRLWDVATGKELYRFEGHLDKIWDVAFCPDGRYVASASQDQTLRLWRVPFVPLNFRRPLPIQIQVEPAPVAAKLPVPDEATLKKLTEEIQDTYKAGFASKDPDELTNLYEKLFQRGLKPSEPPERRYAFLVEASDAAARAGDPLRSINALNELGKRYDVATLPLKAGALQQAMKETRTRSASEAVLGTSLFVLTEAIESDDYDAAERLVNSAEGATRKLGMPVKAIQYIGNEVKRLKARYVTIEPSVAKLRQQPKDAEANRIVGRFRCFDKGDWEHGLPLLGRGDNAKLKDLAQKDEAAPTASTARVAVGDGWWTQAQPQRGIVKYHIQQRACYWYGLALPDAVEKDRTRMEKFIRKHNTEYASTYEWAQLKITPPMFARGALLLSGDHKVLETRQSYAGPIEITALARTTKNNIRLRWAKGSSVIFNWENKPEELRITRPDGAADRAESGSLATAEVKPLPPNTWHLLRWRVTERGMTVEVDDKVVFTENHKSDLSTRSPVTVNAEDSDVEVLSFTVKSLLKKSG